MAHTGTQRDRLVITTRVPVTTGRYGRQWYLPHRKLNYFVLQSPVHVLLACPGPNCYIYEYTRHTFCCQPRPFQINHPRQHVNY
jgi:hypothetical protein